MNRIKTFFSSLIVAASLAFSGLAAAGALTDFAENKLIDATLRAQAIGTPATWEQALKMASRGGTVLEFGGCPPDTQIKLDTELLHYGELTVRGAFHATPTHFKKALNLIASGALDVKPLVTRRMPLDEIREAFEILGSSKTEIKIAIQP